MKKTILRAMLVSSLLLLCEWLLPEEKASTPRVAHAGEIVGGKTRIIDVHCHLLGRYRVRGGPEEFDYEGAASVAISEMNRLGVQKTLIMPPPFPPGHAGRYTADDLAGTARKHPERFGFLDGGGSLNPMIQTAIKEGNTSTALKERFEREAESILSKGAVGFGELTAEHFSRNPNHPYESAPPDHPLFLLLSDIACRHDVPLDIHMEAAPEEMAFPALRGPSSPQNPKLLRANISAFERLLSRNPKTRVIWDHAGWCNTGYRTPALCDELLSRHPNLFMSFKIKQDSLPRTSPLTEEKRLRPEWIDLLRKHPDRFLIGSDTFYVSPRSNARVGPPGTEGIELLLEQLPMDLASMVRHENALQVFRTGLLQ